MNVTGIVTWSELCESEEFRGSWVALDQCRYDEQTAKPIEGTVWTVAETVTINSRDSSISSPGRAGNNSHGSRPRSSLL